LSFDVSVRKVWYGADVTHPTSVEVTLYRDGKEFDTVKLSAENGWTYVWEDLTDEFEWKVDEPSVPSGYNKSVANSGYDYVITNTQEDIPITGDFNSLLGLGAMAAASMTGFGFSALALLKRNKKREEEE